MSRAARRTSASANRPSSAPTIRDPRARHHATRGLRRRHRATLRARGRTDHLDAGAAAPGRKARRWAFGFTTRPIECWVPVAAPRDSERGSRRRRADRRLEVGGATLLDIGRDDGHERGVALSSQRVERGPITSRGRPVDGAGHDRLKSNDTGAESGSAGHTCAQPLGDSGRNAKTREAARSGSASGTVRSGAETPTTAGMSRNSRHEALLPLAPHPHRRAGQDCRPLDHGDGSLIRGCLDH